MTVVAPSCSNRDALLTKQVIGPRSAATWLARAVIWASSAKSAAKSSALPLWARIRDSVTNFLTTQWRSGALFGATPEEAFFVKVDETTTTQDDRDNGIVNILVGIAPVKPAEFVVFQIGQAPSSVIIAEG